MTQRFAVIFTLIPVIAVQCATSINAQQASPKRLTFMSRFDTGIPFPAIEGVPGQKDPQALRELEAAGNLSLAAGSSGIEAVGKLIMSNQQEPVTLPASLIIERNNRLRVDVQGSGDEGFRVRGSVRSKKRVDGTAETQIMSLMGGPFWLAFQLLETSKRSDVSVIDDGNVTLGGTELHRVTMIAARNPQFLPQAPSLLSRTPVSFYFDPSLHTLVKSVATVRQSDDPSKVSLQVVTYSDYRNGSGYLWPFRITETDNGQLRFAFQAQSISETQLHNSMYFSY